MRAIKGLSRFVTEEGELDLSRIDRSERLYQGMNGRYVERFYVSSGESYIFKPVTHQGQEEREIWIYEQVLPRVPSVYPALLERSGKGQPGWAIFEDLGALSHEHRPKTLLRMVKLAARWHSLGVSGLDPAAFKAPKPPVRRMADELLERAEEVDKLLMEAALPKGLLAQAVQQIEESELAQLQVLNHGDLHAGNYAMASGRLYVLDWEHAHLNSPLWDLYHLLDMSHPVFPRSIPVTTELRAHILRLYAHQWRYFDRTLDEARLLADYCGYSVLFTLWMLLLVESDLRGESVYWSRPQLLRQRQEAIDSLRGCGTQLLQGSFSSSCSLYRAKGE